MKQVKYPESIHCVDCSSPVRMMDCRVMEKPVKGKTLVEFDCVCVNCGKWFSATRDREYLQYGERDFCQKKGFQPVGSREEKKGVATIAPKRQQTKRRVVAQPVEVE